ncbi:hypothetical protein CDLVIII_5299 [Clostridium sp. DL-VIII]|nr:hypothetical protein CDLVIII_5299 [Clostridium sp. DL-VIII]
MFMSIDKYLKKIDKKLLESKLNYKKYIIGKSRNNKDIILFEIYNMDINAMFLGFPHPNEPLSQIIINNVLDLALEIQNGGNKKWMIIPVWDVDGAEINEKWWKKDDYTILDIIKYWYRPSTLYAFFKQRRLNANK